MCRMGFLRVLAAVNVLRASRPNHRVSMLQRYYSKNDYNHGNMITNKSN